MGDLILRPAQIDDGPELVRRMNAIDRSEIEAVGDCDDIVRRSLSVSTQKFAVVNGEGRLVTLFGLSYSYSGDVARPWSLSTDLLSRHWREWAMISRNISNAWAGEYRLMENMVWAGHLPSIRWLTWLGFKIGEVQPFGPKRAPFRRFSMERADV